jgi:hypothetical protein
MITGSEDCRLSWERDIAHIAHIAHAAHVAHVRLRPIVVNRAARSRL